MTLLAEVIVFGLAVSVSAIPFTYYDVPTSDSSYASIVDKFKKILEKEGLINPSDIKAISQLQTKNELYRTSYKANFYTTTGKECYYKWREVLYASSFIAEHTCSMIPKVLPPRTKETTATTEEPTKEDGSSSGSSEDDTATIIITGKDGARALRMMKKKTANY